jgi:hypothetical protein
MAIPHYTYLLLKMPAPNGVLSIYGDLMVAFKCNSEAFDIIVTTTCTDASAVLVTKAAMVSLSNLTVPEKRRTDTTMDATLSTKRVRLDLPDPKKMIVILDDLGEK